ncbi:MAG: hypothetical protein QF381_00930 [Nitrososphaerales archaeon]|jgi:hypothetical protein|nr:hypothetical protein [Nitrososphaerales archaeon]|tara:strand:- start:10619 stop:11119 length:501 start_codon:yes stop_codon:yes gene_type:complete
MKRRFFKGEKYVEMSGKRNKKKFAYIVLGTTIIIVGLTLFALQDTNNSEMIDDETRELNKLAVRLVKDFKGTDDKGSTIEEHLIRKINLLYNNEDIFNDLSTELDWSASRKLGETNKIFEVIFSLKTYREDSKFIFNINIENGEISSGNVAAKVVINTVNSISGIG